ncbi:MAG: MBL fold metallo-hydrolase [Candidatus Marinimicrobia bacterium]|nr:MBL fold metallo-hydrolase [Candidatus Neomarinimicrobiota bacterium]MCF7830008.1 MBL fold metallo-hydrolase [Candidatus Neomarinimicrobiota bacterium]MCF7881950.1 MBL fold metallo-hydrolase [Candidatus Neomarinimicrobiota bacterium]
MRFRILGSGSKGNACVVQTDKALILVDNGFSGKEVVRRLESVEIDPKDINGIIVSHEHNDHIKGVGIFARRYKTPVYISHQTYNAAKKSLKNTEIRFFTEGKELRYEDLVVDTFQQPHDAVSPVGFTFRQQNGAGPGAKLGYVTDLGQVTTLVRQRLSDIQALVVEANHDEKMLMNGPYPWRTKQRVRGRYGHLSNAVSAQLIGEIVESTGIEEVTLAHLSENNNLPALARDTVLKHVEESAGQKIEVRVASQHTPSEEIILE